MSDSSAPSASSSPVSSSTASPASSSVSIPSSSGPASSGASVPDPSAARPIKDWAPEDQPREKLMNQGPRALSDGELVALLLGSGTRTRDGAVSAVEIGRAMVQHYDGLYRLSRRPLKELTRTRGVGTAKATKLMAAFEMARRIDSQRAAATAEPSQVTSPETVASIYGPKMRDLKKEQFWVLFLNTANHIMTEVVVSEGGLSSSIVEPRAVFERAILENAASLICLHNHPSGNPEPSREDIRVTRQLVDAGRTMGIPVHDHLIIAGDTFTSLAERGVMD